MESKDPVPWLYMRIAGVDLGCVETQGTDDDEAKRSLFWPVAAGLVGASFALTLACGPGPDEGGAVAPMAVVSRANGPCDVDGGVPGVAGDGDDTCTGGTGTTGTTGVGATTTVGTGTGTATGTATASVTTTIVVPGIAAGSNSGPG